MLEVFHREGIVRRPIVISPFFTKVSVSGPQDVENTLSKVKSFLVEGLEDFDVISHRKFENETLRNAQWELRHISRFHFSELTIRVLYNDENTLLVEFSRSNKSSTLVFHDIFQKIKPYLEDQTFVQWSSENKINPDNYSSNPRGGIGGSLPSAAFILQPYFDVLHNIERSVSERSSPDSIITAAQMVSDIAHAHNLDSLLYATCVNILAQTLIYGEDYELDTLQFVLVHFQALFNAGDSHFINIEPEKLPHLMNALVMIAGKCSGGSSVEGSTTASGTVSLITEQDVGIISFGKSVQVALDILYSIVTRTDRSFEELNALAKKIMERLGDQIRRLDSLRLLRPDLQTALTKCTTTQKKSKDGKEK